MKIWAFKTYSIEDWLDENLSVINKTEQRRLAELVTCPAGIIFDESPRSNETKRINLMDRADFKSIQNLKAAAFNKAVKFGTKKCYQLEITEANKTDDPASYIEAIISEYEQEIKDSDVHLSEIVSTKINISGIDAALYKKIMDWDSPQITTINDLYFAKAKYRCKEKLKDYLTGNNNNEGRRDTYDNEAKNKMKQAAEDAAPMKVRIYEEAYEIISEQNNHLRDYLTSKGDANSKLYNPIITRTEYSKEQVRTHLRTAIFEGIDPNLPGIRKKLVDGMLLDLLSDIGFTTTAVNH